MRADKSVSTIQMRNRKSEEGQGSRHLGSEHEAGRGEHATQQAGVQSIGWGRGEAAKVSWSQMMKGLNDNVIKIQRYV